MDITQAQVAVEQALNYIQDRGPNAMDSLLFVLSSIKAGADSISVISILIAKYPALTQVIDKLIALIQAGASIPEIASMIAEFASGLSISMDALINLLYMIGGALALL
ncbi:MAG: hypothetical protein NW224_22395 [Leptolyngbyaceae cyanobacterium bins.302]|nr:hypothetical protein [Leptolyngbyaceae cyanobacterium bins.302]